MNLLRKLLQKTLHLLILMEMQRKLVTFDKVFVQTSLKKNLLILSYIFLLNVNFENYDPFVTVVSTTVFSI